MKSHVGLVCLLMLAGAAGCDGDKAAEGKAAAAVSDSTAAPKAANIEGAAVYPFSNTDSTIAFVGSKITQSHDGGFGSFEGSIQIPDGKIEQGAVHVSIDVSSITSDTERLTGHLKSEELLDVAKFPKAVFASTSVAPGTGDATHIVTGNFELHGVTKTISFPAKIDATGDAVSVDAEFKFNRKDFGIVYPGMPDDLIKDDVVIRLKIRAKKSA